MAGFEQLGNQEKVEVINELMREAEIQVKFCEGIKNLPAITIASKVLNKIAEKISELQDDLSEEDYDKLVDEYNVLADRQQKVANEFNDARKAK